MQIIENAMYREGMNFSIYTAENENITHVIISIYQNAVFGIQYLEKLRQK